MVYHGGPGTNLEAELNKVFDDALETLRWVRLHYHEPRAPETLRDLEAKIGYLAQAMDWQLDGESDHADQAMGLAQGRSFRDQDALRQMWEEMWWSH